MPPPSPTLIADIVLGQRQVYDLDTDSHIRQVADRVTARVLFELLTRLDDQSADFASHLAALVGKFPGEEPSSLIGFAKRDVQTGRPQPDISEPPPQSCEHYLRLVFRDEQAAYYQFHLFPNLDSNSILGASRKRVGAIQHLHLVLNHSEALQRFVESCRRNPHFLRIEESTAEEFHRAPSHAV